MSLPEFPGQAQGRMRGHVWSVGGWVGGGIEVGVPMGMHRGMDCWGDGEMNRINGRWVDVWRCGATVGWRRVGG